MNAMAIDHHWLLPEGVDELPPPKAAELEGLRRQLLDLYDSWGYDLILPPFLEYMESLLVSGGDDLALRTFKVTDLITGRTLGVRADITPQAARIDAHKLNRESPVRLCYCGTVLHTRAENPAASRAPLQVGAELYGHDGIESELEILDLMVRTLDLCGVKEYYLDLGHVGIFRNLARRAGLSEEGEQALFEALQRKATSEIEEIVARLDLAGDDAAMFVALAELSGDDALERAGQAFANAGDEVLAALAELAQVARGLKQRFPQLAPHFDLAELRGYHYHTGIVFAGFVPELGQEVMRGGRYNEYGRSFGRARPAVGFSGDLRNLFQIGKRGDGGAKAAIFAPWSEEKGLAEEIARLRGEGRRVTVALPGQNGDASDLGCNEELYQEGDNWKVRPLKRST
jgi:ATP phosphoribosyltransferase regulatory subunit